MVSGPAHTPHHSQVAYTITAAISLQRVQQLLNDGHSYAPWVWTIPAAVLNVLLSQAPSLEASWLGSIIAAGSAFLYSAIVIGLGIANWSSAGNISGVETDAVDKIFGMAAGIGIIMFAFAYRCCCCCLLQLALSTPLLDAQFSTR